MALPAGTRLGPYEILAAIGAGGMGEVYRARDTRLDRTVAIKVLTASLSADAELLRRFEQEARAAGILNHPNITAVFDVGTVEGAPYVVQELLEGVTLRGALAAGPLPARKASDYATQICEGLAAAHAKGIVHRDLKPENLFVTKNGYVKILDFGLASRRPLDAAGREQTAAAQHPMARLDQAAIPTEVALTEPGVVMGTVGYMSPEQARGRPADARSDIFSFGAVLFEMLSGRRPFQRETAAETLTAILRDEPPELAGDLRDSSPSLERIARRCLEKDPEARFQLARDVAFAIEAVAGAPAPRRAAEPAGISRDAKEQRRSVAVLFFKDLAGNAENAHLGLGLADSTITELALVKSLLVRPTAAILRYQDRSVDPQQAGRELGVDAVVDGSFQRSGSRLRVTVQLISTADGRSLWGSKIDTTLDDVFRMQDEVSRRIAEALEVQLSPADERRMARAPRPAGKAYELYLKGRFHLFHESLEELDTAIGYFEQSRQADPGFALAWAGLSAAYVRKGFTFDPEGDWVPRAEAMCEKALAIDSGLAQGHLLKALLAWTPRRGFDHATAIRESLAAIAGQPSLSEAHERLGVMLFHVSMIEESTRHFEQALDINPAEQTAAKLHLGFNLYLEGNSREALALSLDAEGDEPSAWGLYQAALCQIRMGNPDTALETASRGALHVPGDPLSSSLRGLIAASRGDTAEAREQIALTMGNSKSFGHYHHAQYDLACIHALLGEREAALDRLTDAARNGFPCYSFFERDPFLESIRGEERFSRLMDALKVECDGYRRLYRRLAASHGASGSRQALAPSN